jgi:DNA-binding protein HU-beta
MTKKLLIDTVSMAMSCSRAEAQRFIDVYHATLIEQLTLQGKFTIQGVGSLQVKTRQERTGRNPRTGDSITIPERQVVQFKVTAPLLRSLN